MDWEALTDHFCDLRFWHDVSRIGWAAYKRKAGAPPNQTLRYTQVGES